MLPVIKKILNEILVCTKLQILFFTDIFLIKIVKFVKFVSLKGLLYKSGEKVLFKKFLTSFCNLFISLTDLLCVNYFIFVSS